MGVWRRLWARVVAIYRGFVVAVPAPGGRRRRASTSSARGREAEASGKWYFRRDILEYLDDYFYCVGRLRKLDRNGYALLSRVGASIVVRRSHIQSESLSSLTAKGRTYGAVAFLGVDEGAPKYFPAKFCYFQKVDRPIHVEPGKGDVYSVIAFHTRHNDPKKLCGGTQFHVSVVGDVVKLLREVVVTTQTINSKRGPKGKAGRRSRVYLSHRKMAYPENLKWWYSDYEDDYKKYKLGKLDDTQGAQGWVEGPLMSIEEWSALTFSVLVNAHFQASIDIRVRVQKRGLVAVFTVDMLRTPHFFQDRELVLTPGGRRKPIFHIVRTHPRRLAGGRLVPVKTHFRGVRTFTWNDYEVNITMPGFHHADPLTMDFSGMEILDGDKIPRKTLSVREFAGRLDDSLNV